MPTSIRLTIPDDLYTLLADRGAVSGQSPETVATRLLQFAAKETQHVAPGTRMLVLSGEAMEQLEEILGGGSLLNQADLLRKVARLAGISFLHIRLPFTPNQLEALKEKAERNSLTVEQLVQRTAPRIYEQFFDLVARA